MNLVNRNILLLSVYILLITGISIVYDYPETLFKRPQSVHNWRQCDGASLALNYYQEGMHFFRPQTHMLYSDNYTTGYTAPSEIPLLYYFVAILYKIFGYHEFIFRAVNLLIFYIGLFYLFRLADTILHNIFYAAVVTMLIFSDAVLVYYANNFLPNTVALSFSFIGWYYFYKYYLNKKTKTFLLSALFFSIAGSMKITELTGPIIILTLLFSDRIRITKLELEAHRHFWLKTSSLLLIFVVVAGWVLYARHYNSLHGSVQFMTYTIPIWDMSRESIDHNLHLMNGLWIKLNLYPLTLWFMIGCLVVTVALYNRSNRLLLFICLAEFVALIAFMLLWFNGLGEHDYFLISFYILPALLFINFFVILKSFVNSRVHKFVFGIVFFAFVVLNVIHAQNRHTGRYEISWLNDYTTQKSLYTIGPWLQSAGITGEERIVFYPSRYIRPLYLMNLKGWVIPDHQEITAELEVRDSIYMKTYTDIGADYFITNDIKAAIDFEPFKPYMKDLHAKYNDIFIFRLPPINENFNRADITNSP